MRLKHRDAIKALQDKGFKSERHRLKRDHYYYFYHYKGRRTASYIYLSHGNLSQEIGDKLLKPMKQELQLDSTQQVKELLSCPMKEPQLVKILSSKGLLVNDD